MTDISRQRRPAEWKKLFESKTFRQEFQYEGRDLGAVYAPDRTDFSVWAPTAERVELSLYRTGSDTEAGAALLRRVPMEKRSKGVWRAAVKEDLAGVYYTYLVTADGQTRETADIYATACGVNGQRSMVLDMAAACPEDWDADGRRWESAEYADWKRPVIYEVHVKDFSNDPCSGVPEKFRGKYLAFTCRETGLNGDLSKPTCVAWLKRLGITHVHLLPIYDFGSVNEACEDSNQFNWGYDPLNYNAPEGSYSTDPCHGERRVLECRQMIKALHDAGIGVIMDVVYNHTYSADSWFQRTVPYYYYRLNDDGSWSNGSVCGNDTASERFMFRKFMVESVLHWARDYHLDGFRFDLMGLHDVETMNLIRKELNALPGGEHILMYGEPWAGGPTAMEEGYIQAVKANAALLDPGISFFNDDTRDAVKGSVFFAEKAGFVQGEKGLEDKIRSSVLAWCDGTGGYLPHSSRQVLSYVSAHDNFTLWDKLLYTRYREPFFLARDEEILRQNKLAAGIYLTCLGIPFLQAGEEAARTKRGEGDSYNRSVYLNQLDWKRMHEYAGLAEYYAVLIALRRHFSAFWAADRRVLSQITFLEAPEGAVAFHFKGDGAETDWLRELVVIYNASKLSASIGLPDGSWDILYDGSTEGTEDTGEPAFQMSGFAWTKRGRLAAKGTARGSIGANPVCLTLLGKGTPSISDELEKG